VKLTFLKITWLNLEKEIKIRKSSSGINGAKTTKFQPETVQK
jgi:hypothetical protein